jgi:hypothetical protein
LLTLKTFLFILVFSISIKLLETPAIALEPIASHLTFSSAVYIPLAFCPFGSYFSLIISLW